MSKRKPLAASKHHGPKIAGKAQRASRQVVRSPTDSVTTVAIESPSKRHNDDPKQEAPPVGNPVTMTATGLKNGFDVFSATANVRAYQAKLLEMAQADMQVAFEFVPRLATSKSPVEFLIVIGEFTSRRIFMFRKYANEMVELSVKRLTT
jgi:hypothetical protein